MRTVSYSSFFPFTLPTYVRLHPRNGGIRLSISICNRCQTRFSDAFCVLEDSRYITSLYPFYDANSRNELTLLTSRSQHKGSSISDHHRGHNFVKFEQLHAFPKAHLPPYDVCSSATPYQQHFTSPDQSILVSQCIRHTRKQV